MEAPLPSQNQAQAPSAPPSSFVSKPGLKPKPAFPSRPRASVFSLLLFFVAILVFLLAYFIFSKPDTGPASLIFSRIFPKESGLIRLQEVDLDIDSIINHPVFSRLEEQSPLPLEIPPLGKPNPFL
jgi:hypothetical protein